MKRVFIYSLLVFVWSCNSSSDPEPSVSTCDNSPTVVLLNKTDLIDCSISDGTFTLQGEGGVGALEYSIDGSTFQSSGTFENLAANIYEATIKDANGCTALINVEILNPNSTVSLTNIEIINSGCKESNGTITVNAVGMGTLSFALNNGSAQLSNTFSQLTNGLYAIVVTDDNGCQLSRNVNLTTGTSFKSQVKSILDTNCSISKCHNGDLGSSRDWTDFSNVQSNADNIKSRTKSGNMPPANSGLSLSQQQKDLIACWVDDGAINN